jgi:hypothetical protein
MHDTINCCARRIYAMFCMRLGIRWEFGRGAVNLALRHVTHVINLEVLSLQTPVRLAQDGLDPID